MEKTKEDQYQRVLDIRDKEGITKLGLFTNQDWFDDPKHFLFMLSRYKFVSKMLSGKNSILEIGCGDGFATRIVLQEVEKLTAIDFDSILIEDASNRNKDPWKVDFKVHDVLKGPLVGEFDAAYAIDVIEHISKENENRFVSNIADSLNKNGVLIIGTPTIQSQEYATEISKKGHVNCMDHQQLRNLMSRFFEHVFIFSMNDEVIHTGYYKMAHYLFALCCSRKG